MQAVIAKQSDSLLDLVLGGEEISYRIFVRMKVVWLFLSVYLCIQMIGCEENQDPSYPGKMEGPRVVSGPKISGVR